MDLKDRLKIVRLSNKFKNFRGIKSFKITEINELTEQEMQVFDNLYKVDCEATDKIPLNANYTEYISWSKEKIKPYINYNSEIIIIDSGKAVFLVFDDIELFLEDYFGGAECFSIDILNRDVKKWIIIYKTEYYLEYFNQDV